MKCVDDVECDLNQCEDTIKRRCWKYQDMKVYSCVKCFRTTLCVNDNDAIEHDWVWYKHHGKVVWVCSHCSIEVHIENIEDDDIEKETSRHMWKK